MRLLSLLGKLSKTDTQLAATTIAGTGAAAYLIFDNLTATAEVSDELIKKTGADVSDMVYNFKETKKELLKKYDIGFWRNLIYEVKDFFTDIDILSEIEEKYEISEENADLELYKESAKKYFRELIGDTTGKPQEEIDKLYQEAEKTFILQITHAPEERRQIWNRVMPAVIGELKAEDRGTLAEDFMKLSESRSDEIEKAMGLLENADGNLTQKDAFGETPDIDVATTYHSAYNQGIDEIGARIAIASTDRKAGEIDIEYCKQLQAIKANGGTLSPQEEELLTKYENLVLASYAGSMTGLSANSSLSTEFVNSCLEDVNQSLLTYDIQNEVYQAVFNYTSSHTDFAEKVACARGDSFEQIMDRATNGAYTTICQSFVSTENPTNSSDIKSDKETTVKNTENQSNNKPEESGTRTNKNDIAETNSFTYNPTENSYISNPFVTQTISTPATLGSGITETESFINNTKGPKTSSAFKHRAVQTFIPKVINSYEESVDFINNTEGSIHAIVMGKVKVNPAADNVVISMYKCMDNSEKGELLSNATDEWYEELKKHTPDLESVINNYLASGNKGLNYERTKDMEKYRNDKHHTFHMA